MIVEKNTRKSVLEPAPFPPDLCPGRDAGFCKKMPFQNLKHYIVSLLENLLF